MERMMIKVMLMLFAVMSAACEVVDNDIEKNADIINDNCGIAQLLHLLSSDVENEFILLLIKNKEADNNGCQAEAESIKQMIYAEHSSVKNSATEHFRN